MQSSKDKTQELQAHRLPSFQYQNPLSQLHPSFHLSRLPTPSRISLTFLKYPKGLAKLLRSRNSRRSLKSQASHKILTLRVRPLHRQTSPLLSMMTSLWVTKIRYLWSPPKRYLKNNESPFRWYNYNSIHSFYDSIFVEVRIVLFDLLKCMYLRHEP